ncbi:hypothetical protein DFS34DRAFT_22142 [Phlyctochytrium arcticum]|nr:hypothetical protein DFS34DRAFT_22142 [Phlyctochytrium arcticum]
MSFTLPGLISHAKITQASGAGALSAGHKITCTFSKLPHTFSFLILLHSMLRTPWAQDETEQVSRRPSRSSGIHAPTGTSQIILGNYHEPFQSSYRSMTTSSAHSNPGSSGPADTGAHTSDGSTADFLDRAHLKKQQSFRDNFTDVFNVRSAEDSDAQTQNSNKAGMRCRPDRNSSTVFGSQPDLRDGMSWTPPTRVNRQSSDIFHLADRQMDVAPATYQSAADFDRYGAEAMPEPMQRPAHKVVQQRAAMFHESEYAPSPSSAVRRNPSETSLRLGSSEGDDLAGFRGRRHYPGQHHASNIFNR